MHRFENIYTLEYICCIIVYTECILAEYLAVTHDLQSHRCDGT